MNRPTTSLAFSVLRLGAFLVAMVLLGVPLGAAGSAFVVDSTADEIDANPGDGVCAAISGDCTLRAAIMETNAVPGPDAITLPAGVYLLTIPGANEDAGATGDLDIVDDLTISGAGAQTTKVDGAGLDRVFHALGDWQREITVEFRDLSITGGYLDPSGNLEGAGVEGWGATVSLDDSDISGNEGRGVYASTADGMGRSLSLSRSTISMNTVGGLTAVGLELYLTDCTVEGNGGPGNHWGAGIAIYNFAYISSDAHILRTVIRDNDAGTGWGGGIASNESTVEIVESTVEQNRARVGGGAALGLNGEAGNTLTIRDSSITSNSALEDGGGISLDDGQSPLSLINSTVSGNDAGGSGGGIYVGLYDQLHSVGSTITDNVASGQLTSRVAQYGASRAGGGGIFVLEEAAPLNFALLNGTILATNYSPLGPDCLVSVDQEYGAAIVSEGSVIVGDASGCSFTSGPGDQIGVEPLLGPLQDNGGPTLTHALLPGSPAIDAFPLADCTWDDDWDPGTPEVPLNEDQRGINRPRGPGCDIGSFERAPSSGPSCGLGPELVLLTPLLMFAHGRRRRRERIRSADGRRLH